MGPQNWMGSVPDDVYLSQLSIPGTHDTLTFEATPVAEDQDTSFDIAAQLNAGIRYFDLRLIVNLGDDGHGNTTYILQGIHGGLLDNTEFAANILQPTITFLTNNPTECVIYQLQNYGCSDPSFPTTWDQVLRDYIAQDYGWFYTTNVVPTLGEVRQQIVLADYNNHGTQGWGGLDFTGFPYNADGSATTTLTLPDGQPVTFWVQNIYDDNSGSSDRREEGTTIQNNIGAAAGNWDPHKWYITFTSRANGIPSSRAFALGWNPPFFGDVWPSTIGYNQVALDAINATGITGGSDQVTVGTVMSDFPNDTNGYIEAIYARNPTPGGWTPSLSGWEILGQAGGGFDLSKQPAAVSWGTNRLDIFAVGSDGQMYHKAWNSGSWSPPQTGWEALGNRGLSGPLAFSSPAAVSWGANRLDVFAASQGQIWHRAWDGGSWSPPQTWLPLGPPEGLGFPPLISAPAAVSCEAGRLDVFAVGSDNQMYHKSGDGDRNWSPYGTWEALGPLGQTGGGFDPNTRPAVVSWGPDRMDIFGVGSDGQMYHKAWDSGSWSPSEADWEALGTPTPDDTFNNKIATAATSIAANELNVFALGAAGSNFFNQMYHKAWRSDIGWTATEIVGGAECYLNSAPAAVSWGATRLDVFGVGVYEWPACQMWHKAWEGNWVPAGDLLYPLGTAPCTGGFNSNSAPAAVSWGAGRVDVFAVGRDGQMYHKYWTDAVTR